MKRINKYLVIFSLLGLVACSNDDSLGESRLDLTPKEKTALDTWIDDVYTDPYNVRVFYRWDPTKVDMGRFLTPVAVDKVQPALKVVNQIWLETYKELAGVQFVKETAPRELVLVGSNNMNTNGTITLGVAEQGVRITLFSINTQDFKNKSAVERFIHTIQHEYVHILNQTAPFDKDEYGSLTPADYMSDWHNGSVAEANSLGFITSYARSNVDEDFAEQASAMLTNLEDYNKKVEAISSAYGKGMIRKKEALVVAYYKRAFDIDFYELCRQAAINTDIAINF